MGQCPTSNVIVQSSFVEIVGIAKNGPLFSLAQPTSTSNLLAHAMQPVDERLNRKADDPREFE
jgi:hypothetical protein